MKQIILLMFFLLAACSFENKEAKIGEKSKELSARDIQGNPVFLKDSQEKVKVIVFFQNGCTSCLKELPMFDAFIEQNKDKIAVYAVNSFDNAEVIATLAQQLELKNIKVLKDDLNITSQRYQIFATPTTIFIKDGIIQQRILGEKSWEFIESKLIALL
ncbi:TlpA disulfide reductase family protein [Campylobacter sp. MIT 21-1685]|uniref:TlpA family protein disulfide reductase n=1 Tax=unclassified Campylobacter TaxID=2593542 RepID=UPI00224BA0D4|nr:MULTISPECIES: TlpA disulfide reductase family protein [unclassified Campylobacter]MCX2682596.1 TlpA disulfide reductase family protein [Campylobacter sp. MIT 21-1684]MCX2750876.1 TlpA disulfide reductase family protein [Campylobacter sp. MIT 21-1682]MCX2807191.1 TlpA disulfide reductase family protein [Campylobacter sp. MIT 21-1685]